MKPTLSLVVALVAAVSCSEAEDKEPGETAGKKIIEVLPQAQAQPAGTVQKTDEEWKKILTPEQRQKWLEATK